MFDFNPRPLELAPSRFAHAIC